VHRGWIKPPDSIDAPLVSLPIRQHTPASVQLETKECGYVNSRGVACKRRDANICPHHGKIIERDGVGAPVDVREREREADARREIRGRGWMMYQGDVERLETGRREEVGVRERLRKRLKVLKR
jgi:hypothetical protein